ncbi:transglutaminase-like domain-containing protein [Sphaerochaeta sp. PS]|uniref:transglutaminase-like domain-containing protein n=1 Tax=Sphaerochaeta sp. PS TaxID=3076336 RepID=UPI0028A4071B|nr:transglutaminase-like domain-containing protein [Sphaerochaeta sp. PS]MDT4763333.1 transglutaminase-like domain-containing protein [Sphaerochaeta sp. PS]
MNARLACETQTNQYLEQTQLLDYSHPTITKLIAGHGWTTCKSQTELIDQIYTFVRDEIPYGYSESFTVNASQVLLDGYGNCLSKSTLLMALLRAVGIPCRFHASTISKVIYRGLLLPLSYRIARDQHYHAWVEVLFNNRWLELEGHIIDKPYLQKLQQRFPDYMGSFYGYGIAVLNFKNPDNRWQENHTYVQHKAVETDLGTFHTPDSFFSQFPKAGSYTKSFRYKTIIKRRLNHSITAMRNSKQ